MCVFCRVIFFQNVFHLILKALNVAVGLQAGEEDVEEPQSQEEQAGQEARHLGTAQLSTNRGPASEQEHAHRDESKDGEEGDREGQRPWIYPKFFSLGFPVDSGHRPGHADTQEHVDSVAASDISNRCISMLVLCGSHFTSKGVWKERKRRRE